MHDDHDLGPVNIAPTKTGALGRAEEDLVAARRRYYREAVNDSISCIAMWAVRWLV